MDRPQPQKLLRFVREDKTVIVKSISRFAGNTRDLLELIERLNSKQVNFVSKKESLDTTTPSGKFMPAVFGAVAELKREYILPRQREGIVIARAKGIYKEGKRIEQPEFAAITKRWKAGQITAVEAMKRLDMKPSTFYRRAKEVV